MRWLLMDSIEILEVGDRAVGRKVWAEDEEFFVDHFPSFPVVPGVLLLEALAQLAGKLIGYTVRRERGDWPFPILSMMNGVKFRRFVRPGELVELQAKMTTLREEMAVVDVHARCEGKIVSQAEQIFVFNAVPLESEQDREKVEALERTHLKRLWADYPENE